MGTRGFVGFVAEGREVIAYQQFDSYPSGVGVDTLRWLRSANLDVVAQRVASVKLVSDDVPPTDEDIQALRESYDPQVDQGRSDRPTWYQLVRRNQGDLGAMIRAGYVLDASTFPTDSLYAEWGYIVDFDAKRFEVYEGFQERQHRDGRFAERPQARPGYWPVRLVASWPLDALPDEDAFCATLEGDDAESGAE